MNKTQRNLLLSFLYLLCLYLFCVVFPYDRINIPEWSRLLIDCLLLIVVVSLCLFEKKRCDIHRETKYKKSLIYLPILIACFSNIIYGLCFKVDVLQTFSLVEILVFAKLTLSVLIEELLFRFFLIELIDNSFDNKNKDLISISLSALCFSLFHLINLFGNNVSTVLIQVGYTFVLGMILGIIRVDTGSILIAFIAHLLFNFFNDFLFTRLFQLDEYTISYIVINILFAIFSLTYAITVYLLRRKKNNA